MLKSTLLLQRASQGCVGGGFVLLAVLGLFAGGCDKQISVTTDPPGAKIYWNSEEIGPSPCTITYPSAADSIFPELHIIETRQNGYEPYYHYVMKPKTFTLGPQKVHLTLTPLPEGFDDSDMPASLRVEGNPKKSGRKANADLIRAACEIRVVRVSDGRVICQASALAGSDQLALLATTLAEQLKDNTPRGSIAVGSMRNRRQSEAGKMLAEKLTDMVWREMSFANPSGAAKNIPLRDILPENQLDLPKIVLYPEISEKLRGIRYIVLGGLAETKPTRR